MSHPMDYFILTKLLESNSKFLDENIKSTKVSKINVSIFLVIEVAGAWVALKNPTKLSCNNGKSCQGVLVDLSDEITKLDHLGSVFHLDNHSDPNRRRSCIKMDGNGHFYSEDCSKPLDVFCQTLCEQGEFFFHLDIHTLCNFFISIFYVLIPIIYCKETLPPVMIIIVITSIMGFNEMIFDIALYHMLLFVHE